MDVPRIIDECNKINRIDSNVYFKFDNLMRFAKSQKAFYYAVDHWSKMLAKLLVILPSHKERFVVVKNLNDEHGNGKVEESHSVTFKEFVESLESVLNQQVAASDFVIEPVNRFNAQLDLILNTKSWVFCAATLGIIEYVYITVSKMIHDYVSLYISEKDIKHYTMHEILDMEHATDLFKILENQSKDDILCGLRCGYELFDNLYKGLYAATTSE